ncbi:hypothetical protein EVAR_77795_1 [Eumeta japonica]|uniref:Uncharacterized protein n=1 Tax=Eumeta variegata TaxID=151549 RepID=A0A4C1TC13_EUMVA|nr:hypothetical protein EVAR_77795_1 [Eumeta japonica]
MRVVYCSSGRTIDDAGRLTEFSELGGQVCEHTMGCSAMFARENGVRDDGRWAGDTWYRRGALSKAGGPRSVRVCRSLKGKGQRPGLAANHLVDTVSCGAWRSVAQRTLDRQGREGRGAQRGGDQHKKRIV